MFSNMLGVFATSPLFFILLASAAETDQLLDGINKFRTQTAGVSALTMNEGASCVAQRLLQEYESKPCTNSTGLDTVPGEEPNYPDFPTWLSDCGVGTDRVKDALILPDCIPSGVDSSSFVAVALENFTLSANETIASAGYSSAGVAAGKDWFIVILATNTSSGDYLQQGGSHAFSLHVPSPLTLAFLLASLHALVNAMSKYFI
ncbi:hypothetical protein KP509_38G058500 [Ceratopteris richardii]|uniref:Uncharacterized GPI-anchored protein At5g19230-like domain-containing protein n=1 Tax=Ceratopteris richardii TaxID=49495 RepID=A0A8T2Q5B1_CERRI|nr:hypothetical protein KP509_38G058500 [Ceratopteris richardii]